jgi:hypothetical protein
VRAPGYIEGRERSGELFWEATRIGAGPWAGGACSGRERWHGSIPGDAHYRIRGVALHNHPPLQGLSVTPARSDPSDEHNLGRSISRSLSKVEIGVHVNEEALLRLASLRAIGSQTEIRSSSARFYARQSTIN